MAEQVQAALDKMVGPLADLMDRSIFSQSEIHAIVSRRRNSEYLLRRRVPRKADFIKYIQDELQLEKLRQLRAKKQQAIQQDRLDKAGETAATASTNNLGDPHIVQHIHLLFRRALQRYDREDVSMFLQYADICKELRSFNKLPQIYAQAVQLHPHATGLWIEAASHEFFHRTSVRSARILMQRALRINPKAADLWWQSFALEFHYIAKMKGRQNLLLGHTHHDDDDADADKTNNPQPSAKETDDKEQVDSTLFAVAKIVYDNAIQAIPNDVSFRLGFLDLCKTFPFTQHMEEYIYQSIQCDFKDAPRAWIARAARLLEQAQQQQQQQSQGEAPDKGFLQAPKQTDFAKGGEQESESESTEKNSDHKDKNNNHRPTKKQRTEGPTIQSISEDPVLAMIQKGLQAVPTTEMYMEVIQFLWMYWERVEEVFSEEETIASTRDRVLVFLQNVLKEASSSSLYNASLALQHADAYMRVDQLEDGRQVLAQFVEGSLKEKNNAISTEVWIQLADMTFRVEHSAAEARKVISKALNHTSMNQSAEYLQLLLYLLGAELAMVAEDAKSDKLRAAVTATFQKILLLASGNRASLTSGSTDDESDDENSASCGLTSVEHACFRFLLFAIEAFGPLEGVRRTYQMVLLQSNFLSQVNFKASRDIGLLVSFFDKCLEVEMDHLRKNGQLTKAEKKKGRVNLRQLCKAAVQLFHDVPSLANQYQQTQHEALLL
jgi:U3 small nucleolar RNA-associated protein 6